MRLPFLLLAALVAHAAPDPSPRLAEPWKQAYAGTDESGPEVLGCWHFDDGGKDSSGKGHDLKLTTDAQSAQGRFGGGLESFEGFPKKDLMHGARTVGSSKLTPKGAFTLELWIKPKDGFAETGKAMLIDKKYVSDSDYQWSLSAPEKSGSRRADVILGFGDHSRTYHSEPMTLAPGEWHHLAFTYDGAGGVRFFTDGSAAGTAFYTGEGAIAAGKHPFCVGERVGSNYPGCLAILDEVRLTEGVREFRRGLIRFETERYVFRRMEPKPTVSLHVHNLQATPLTGATLLISNGSDTPQQVALPEIAGGAEHLVTRTLDTSLRPDSYELSATLTFADDPAHRTEDRLAYRIVARHAARMPVLMWGIGSPEAVLNEIPRLKDIGFTHCFGLGADYAAVWDAGKPVPPLKADAIEKAKRMLDEALAQDFGVAASLSPSRWLQDAHPDLLRVDRTGKPYARKDIVASRPELPAYFSNVGASLARAYSAFPAWDAALISTEVRDNSQISFTPLEIEQCRTATGAAVPTAVKDRNGVLYTSLKDFPANRLLPDDDAILKFYRWWWQRGDGWNGLHTALHKGLHSTGRDDVWTWFDPAVRAPSISGSGGAVDVLSHWTYSYPDPIRIGLAADQLFAMSAANGRHQRVMKMTQIIWYRSQTAPTGKAGATPSPWEDHDPEAAYITIAPEHLREALWTKIARPIEGIMYHGWQSLVPTSSVGGYRYTNPDTQHELKRLLHNVIQPLGPMLLEVPDAKSDVAFLQSFTSEMFTRKGGYGSNTGWSGDAWHITQYAHLQSDIVFDETISQHGLDGYNLLFLMDCDVLPQSVVAKIQAWQAAGGVIVGDENTCPAIKPDFLLPLYKRSKKAEQDHAELVQRGEALAKQISARYQSRCSATSPEVVTRLRHAGSGDYLFVVNDRREFGDYVGQHGLVMENGLPTTAELRLRSAAKQPHVYDLVAHREVANAKMEGGFLSFRAAGNEKALAPGDGRMFLITPEALHHVEVKVPETAARGKAATLAVSILDPSGKPLAAVIPFRLDITDPNGREMEWSGYHAAKDGRLALPCDIAANDTRGVWTIRVTELASGLSSEAFMRVE